MPQKNKKYYNVYQREYQLNRYYAIMIHAHAKLGNQCANCGSFDDLEIDHINWREKRLRLNKLWSISRDQLLEELEKCQLLCHDCHAKKTKIDMSEIKTEYYARKRGEII